MFDPDGVAGHVREILDSEALPGEVTWAGRMWDDGRLRYRVTVVDWADDVVKVVVTCAAQGAAFGVANRPEPKLARYLALSDEQRVRGWTVYAGEPALRTHLADMVAVVSDAFHAYEVHREADGSHGLLVRKVR